MDRLRSKSTAAPPLARPGPCRRRAAAPRRRDDTAPTRSSTSTSGTPVHSAVLDGPDGPRLAGDRGRSGTVRSRRTPACCHERVRRHRPKVAQAAAAGRSTSPPTSRRQVARIEVGGREVVAHEEPLGRHDHAADEGGDGGLAVQRLDAVDDETARDREAGALPCRRCRRRGPSTSAKRASTGARWLDAELGGQRRPQALEGAQRVGLRPAAYSARMSWLHRASRIGWSVIRRSRSAIRGGALAEGQAGLAELFDGGEAQLRQAPPDRGEGVRGRRRRTAHRPRTRAHRRAVWRPGAAPSSRACS